MVPQGTSCNTSSTALFGKSQYFNVADESRNFLGGQNRAGNISTYKVDRFAYKSRNSQNHLVSTSMWLMKAETFWGDKTAAFVGSQSQPGRTRGCFPVISANSKRNLGEMSFKSTEWEWVKKTSPIRVSEAFVGLGEVMPLVFSASLQCTLFQSIPQAASTSLKLLDLL